jgi:hypothetical protein
VTPVRVTTIVCADDGTEHELAWRCWRAGLGMWEPELIGSPPPEVEAAVEAGGGWDRQYQRAAEAAGQDD